MFTYKKFPHKDSSLWVVSKDNHPYKVFKSEIHAIIFISNIK